MTQPARPKRCPSCRTWNSGDRTSCEWCGRRFAYVPSMPARAARAARDERTARSQPAARLALGRRCSSCSYPGSMLDEGDVVVCPSCGDTAAT